MLILVLNLASAHGEERSSVLSVVSYDLELDVTGGSGTFFSRTEVRFRASRAGTLSFADLEAAAVRRAMLNGARLDFSTSCHAGHLPLPSLTHENLLIVEAEMGYTSAGAGLYRADGLDGSACVYGKGYPDGARRIYCCFDQGDLRAPFTVSINAPAGWSCFANGPLTSRPGDNETGIWQFAATPPIAPYLSSFCSGRYVGPAFVCPRDDDLPLPVTVNARPPVAALAEAVVSPELVVQPLRYYERVLGAAYPYLKCDLVFVPQYRALAFGAPGLVTIQEQVLTQSIKDESGLYPAAVVAHELAHAWFGGALDMSESDDGWLIEALTTYISRTALEEIHPDIDPWDASTSQTLPDHAYVKYAAPIRQLAQLISTQAVLDGLSSLLHDHMHGCVTKGDVIRSWSQAGGRDLREWAAEKLTPAASENQAP
jgi:aminopeptidase N